VILRRAARPPLALPHSMASDAVGMEARTGIRYGEVRVIIQDGVIVQTERIEKERLR